MADTNNSNTIAVATPGDLDVTLTRVFAAPKALVFDAFTRPELVRRWLTGLPGWSLPVCDIDLRVGGRIRYVWKNPDTGDGMGMSGTFREVTPPDRTVHTEIFDEDWTGGETVVTTEFAEASGSTTVTMTIRFASASARDAALKTGMKDGLEMTYANLDALLAAGS